MSTTSLLVRVPGTPYAVADLLPSAPMAALAATLEESGCGTTIIDHGTTEAFESLYPKHVRPHAVQHAEHLRASQEFIGQIRTHSPAQKFRLPKDVSDHHRGIWERIGEAIAARRDFDFLVFQIDSPKDLKACQTAAKRVRALMPRTTLVAHGPIFGSSHDLLVKSLKRFDCIALGNPCRTIGLLADNIHDREAWKHIPDMAFMDGVRFCLTSCSIEARTQPGALALPLYGPETYPALRDSTKIRLFTIDDVTQMRVGHSSNPRMEWRKTPAKRMVEQVRAINGQYGTLAFHFSGCAPGDDHADVLARELLSQNFRLRYSRDAHISSMSRVSPTTLSASGCSALGFRIDTGSQRLLDTHYKHPFTVTVVERVVRACKFSNLFTTNTYTYPCPQDDYHSQDETLRLIVRSNPEAVLIDIPGIHANGSPGNILFQEFGTPSKSPKKKHAVAHAKLREELDERDFSMDISPRFALLAELAGHRGREGDLLRQMTYQLHTGDAFGLNSTIERINHRATAASKGFQFTPFTDTQGLVAN